MDAVNSVFAEYKDALESQRRTAAAQQAQKFKDEIVPLKTKMKKLDKATGQEQIVARILPPGPGPRTGRPDLTVSPRTEH